MALTATATPEVVKSIYSSLAMDKKVASFKTPSFRSNLFYSLAFKDEDKGNVYEDLINFILKTLKVFEISGKKEKGGVRGESGRLAGSSFFC